MEKKDTHLENFKQALISTIKSISEKNDCEVSFGKQASKDYNNVNLPEIKQLEHFVKIDQLSENSLNKSDNFVKQLTIS